MHGKLVEIGKTPLGADHPGNSIDVGCVAGNQRQVLRQRKRNGVIIRVRADICVATNENIRDVVDNRLAENRPKHGGGKETIRRSRVKITIGAGVVDIGRQLQHPMHRGCVIIGRINGDVTRREVGRRTIQSGYDEIRVRFQQPVGGVGEEIHRCPRNEIRGREPLNVLVIQIELVGRVRRGSLRQHPIKRVTVGGVQVRTRRDQSVRKRECRPRRSRNGSKQVLRREKMVCAVGPAPGKIHVVIVSCQWREAGHQRPSRITVKEIIVEYVARRRAI